MKRNKHDDVTRLISLNPRKIGLENIALSTGESNLFLCGRIVRQPDGLSFDPSTRTLYNIEYKSSNRRRNHAQLQLEECQAYLSEVFPKWNIINLYIHEDYKVEKI